jgi:hypothetical protein
VECKWRVSHALKLCRERGGDTEVAQALGHLSDTNRLMGLHEEGIRQGKEALEILERLDGAVGQARCLVKFTFLLHSNEQLDAAFRGIDLLPEKGEEFLVCESHLTLGVIYSKGESEKVVHHYELDGNVGPPLDYRGNLLTTSTTGRAENTHSYE